MSWPSVRAAIATRLSAITGVVNVHQYLRYHAKGLNDATFQSQLTVVATDQPGKRRLNCWQITRRSVAQQQAADCDNVVKRTHSVEIQGFYSFEDATSSEHALNALVDAILNNFNTGDRTLAGNAITHSVPQAPSIVTARYLEVPCHLARITFTVEENV